jgi:hypothetical protein
LHRIFVRIQGVIMIEIFLHYRNAEYGQKDK